MYDDQKKQISQLNSTIYKSDRKHTKNITLLNHHIDMMHIEVATLKNENWNITNNISKKVETAVREDKLKKIIYQLKDKGVLKKILGNKCIEDKYEVALL